VPSPLAVALASLLAFAPASSSPTDACDIEHVTVEWGFKESFRSYVSGTIALGTWTTTGDVSYETPVFVFTGGEGFLAPDRESGEISFDGEFRFTGHGGILNTSLANPRLQFVDGGEAILFLDVTGDTMDGLSVEKRGVDFVRVSWPSSAETVNRADGVFEVKDAEVVLTDLGSGVFGTYISGEIFDPMTISLRVPGGCLTTDGFVWWWIPGGAVTLAALGAAVWAGITRGNKSREPERQ
jgi:hypothetical protein